MESQRISRSDHETDPQCFLMDLSLRHAPKTTAPVPKEKAGYFHFAVSKTSEFCNVLRVGVGSDREVVRGKTADSEFSFYMVPATNSPRGCDSGLETAVRQGGT